MRFDKFLAKRLQEFDIGRYLCATLIQFCLIIAIFIKNFFTDLHILLYFGLVLVCLLTIWLAGFIMIKTNFYEKFQVHNPIYKKLLEEIEKGKK